VRKEFSVPPKVALPTEGNLTDIVVDSAVQAPGRPLFSRKVGERWQDVTAMEFRAEVTAVARGLVAAGIGPGERVAIMSKTRYEWTLLDFAVWFAGGVVVPIYETSSAEQVRWILDDSAAVALVAESAGHVATFDLVKADLPLVREVWQLDAGAVEVLCALGQQVSEDEVAARRGAIGPDDNATIIYTSGTTGPPKGCELTHGNFLAEVDNVVLDLRDIFLSEEAATLLFLPLAHVFARVIELGCVRARVRLGHMSDPKELLGNLASFRPTFLLAVPRVFEKVYNGASQKATADGKGRIFDQAAATAVAYSEALDRGGPGLLLRGRHAVFDKLVYHKLRDLLGGQVGWALSGSAPLGTRLGHFFRGVGITVLEGYGLTETTAAVTVNPPADVRVGTVGRPIPGVTVGIADDGEVLVKGPVVFRGYWRNERATAEAFDPEGWFRSGDIGDLDADGYLTITGRKKEIIVTAGGKNVAPTLLEDRIRAHALVSQCMVVGDGRPYVAALVTIDAETWPLWKSRHGKPETLTIADAVDDPDLRASVAEVIDDGNSVVSHAESIKKFRILPVDFTEEGGQLTPSLKLKRAIVLEEFATDVAALYS
jgi:long-chain acyl-CoA synthetase